MAPPETHYVRSGDARIAYQVVGEGATDLVIVPGLVSHLGLTWQIPEHAQFCRELARFSRVILFDKRGTGLSDRDKGVPGLEQRMDDLLAVMAAARSRRAALFGNSEGGLLSLLFAATYPERVRALVLYGVFVHAPTRVWLPEQVATRFDVVERGWGTALMPPSVAPSKASDQQFRRNWARFERQSASGATAAALMRIDHDLDITDVLPAVRVPTLLMHRVGDRRIPVENGRHLAAHLPDATYLELPGVDHLAHIGDTARVIAETESFILASPVEATPRRAFRTILALKFSEPASSVSELRGIALGEVERFRGRQIAGVEGEFLAAFDGPARAIRCSLAVCEQARRLGVMSRGGLHSGEIELAGDPGAVATLASSVADLAGVGETLASGGVRDLVAGSGLAFKERGIQELPGLTEPTPLYAAAEDGRQRLPALGGALKA